MSPPTPTIAIIGGGITGLTLAIGLLARNIPVKIYERATSFREIGAGIGFSANAEWAMKAVDPRIHAAFKRVSTPNASDWFQYVDGLHPSNDEIKLLFKIYLGERGFEGCARPDFLDELAKLLPPDIDGGVVQFDKTLKDVEMTDGRVTLKFADGSSATADLVVGCDGIHSRVRQLVLGEDNEAAYAHYSHKFAIRGLIPVDKAAAVIGEDKTTTRYMYLGPDCHVLTFPVAQGKLLNVVGFVTDREEWPHAKLTSKIAKGEVVKAFEKFGPTVRGIVGLLPDQLDQWAVFDLFDHPPGTYVRDRMALLGDAAHAASPHHGAGAGCGIEDAAALCAILEEAVGMLGSGDEKVDRVGLLRKALQSYDAVRRERASWVVESSRFIGELYQWQTDAGRDTEKCHKEAYDRCHRIWDFDVDDMIRQAKEDFVARARN